MIVLDHYSDKIGGFILETVQRFKTQNGIPNSVGIYCCPWSGWLTINFNIRKSLEETNNNCPDFEFVEFDVLDFPEWQDEYEADEPKYRTGDKVIQFTQEQGDESLNKIFFSYLLPIVTETKTKIKHKILLQFLDSSCLKILEIE
jgi:hypothetical protein